MVHGLAKTVFEGFVVHTDDKGVSPPRNIVRRGEMTFQKDPVQNRQSVYVTGSQSYNDAWVHAVLYFLFPIVVRKVESGELFAKRKKEVLDRGICDRVVQIHVIVGVDLRKLVDGFAVTVRIDPFGTDRLVLLDEILYELLEIINVQ